LVEDRSIQSIKQPQEEPPMRGSMEAAGARSLPTTSRRGLSVWIADVRRRRRSVKEERLEVIERLGREQRQARRAGEYRPSSGTRRVW
jgi:hypothetical protein